MGGFNLRALLFSALAVNALGASSARAQCRLCATPTTALSQASGSDAIQLDIETSLDFDRLVLAGTGQGAAVIRPDGSNASEGAVTRISARAMVGTAVVHGDAGRLVRIELPERVELYSASGARIVLDDVVSDLPSMPKLDSAGTLTFRFGGRVRIAGETDGDYRGDMPITVEYQ